MTIATDPPLRWRVHSVIAELDARGEIDGHAAMCLRHAIRDARATTVEIVLVDLRDLTAIDTAGLALLTAQHVDCRAHGVELGLLIGGHEHRDQIAEALVLSGLGDLLHHGYEPRPAAAATSGGPPVQAPSAGARRLARAIGRLSARRQRDSWIA